MSIQEIFDKMEDTVEISFCERNFDNKRIFAIEWCEQGRGFGTYTIIEDKNGVWVLDNESDSKEFVKRVFCRLIDKLPLYEGMTEEEVLEHERESEEYTKNSPYFEETEKLIRRKYNKNYGDDRICQCGHPYFYHFDEINDMKDTGCKYCGCSKFNEKSIDKDVGK